MPYAAGYLHPVECLLDPDIGVEYLYADNPRLTLDHHEIMEQGRMVGEARVAVGRGNDIRYTELKTAKGCRGLSTPIATLNYTDSTTFFKYHVAHCMALGLHKQLVTLLATLILAMLAREQING